MAIPARRLATVEAFRDLSREDLQRLDDGLELSQVLRGAVLVRQGEVADALFIVMSGRFTVLLDGRAESVAEIGVGSPIGEIAFFAGGKRTASVVAERDSVVLKLSRAKFEQLAEASPRLWRTITATLARRLADTTSLHQRRPIKARARTICIMQAGQRPIPEAFLARLQSAFDRELKTITLDGSSAAKSHRRGADETFWFNDLEGRFDAVIYRADPALSPWSQKAIRQADLVLCVGHHGEQVDDGSRDPNALELHASSLHKPANIRLVVVRDHQGGISGTRAWLDARPWVHLHHHVALDRDADYERLFRFLTDRARGLVACGGGAFSAAHIGAYEAFREAGVTFDMFGGTSGGAAMAAAFAKGADPDDIERRFHDMFVTRKALRRWTWPRYSLLDHAVFDAALAEHYTDIDIEDLPVPYFAVSTNLSRDAVHCQRRGSLWQAIRASSAIPALLPPTFTADGDMLVDGCLMENVPVRTMHALKAGPNVVVDFHVPTLDRFHVNHRTLPSRWALLWQYLNPATRRLLPPAPTPQAVLLRSLLIKRTSIQGELGPDDLVLELPMPENISHLDWHKHAVLRRLAREFTRAQLARTTSPESPDSHPPAMVLTDPLT